MLRTEPVDASQEAIAIWKTLRPLDSKVFRHYCTKVSPENPNIDLTEADFGDGLTKKGGKWTGMRLK